MTPSWHYHKDLLALTLIFLYYFALKYLYIPGSSTAAPDLNDELVCHLYFYLIVHQEVPERLAVLIMFFPGRNL